MNQRILKLMRECGIPTEKRHVDGEGHGYYTPNYQVEKLAKMIVQECAWNIRMTEFGTNMTQEQVARHIEDHFGVK